MLNVCDFGHQLRSDGHHLHGYIVCPPICKERSTMNDVISKVEMDSGWGPPLLKITTLDGYFYFYYQSENGTLILGQPYVMAPKNGFIVRLFIPMPPMLGSMPILLDIQKL